MRSKRKSFVVMMMLGMLGWLGIGTGTQEAEGAMALSGRLVYIVSDNVREYDLVSGRRSELYRDEDGLLSSPITEVDETSFIVETLRREMLLVGADGRAHVLGEGHSQVFFPAHGKLLYLLVPPGKSHNHLYETTLRNHRLESPRVVAEGPFSGAYEPLAISDDELLVRPDRGPYLKYDLRTGLLVETPIVGCMAMAWRSRTQEVICFNESGKDKGYVLIGLDGRRRRVPGLSKSGVAVYVPQGDYVLGSRKRFSLSLLAEVTDLYSYDFSTGAVQRIAKGPGFPVGPENAFWSPTRRGAEHGRAEELHAAALRGDRAAIEALVEADADVNAKDRNGWTALLHAADTGRVAAIEALVEADADVNAKDRNGWTALLHAADTGQVSAIEALVEAGADVNVEGRYGRTALRGAVAVASFTGRVGVIETLAKAGAAMNVQNQYDGTTVLHEAAFWGRVSVIDALVQAGADVKVKDKKGRTALEVAESRGQVAAVKALKAYGGR